MLKNFLYLTAFSTFVVIIIVGLDVFHKLQISSLSDSTKTRVIPITPTFDEKTLESLNKRKTINVSLDGKSKVTSEDTKSPQILTSPTPLVTVTISQQQISSQSSIFQQ